MIKKCFSFQMHTNLLFFPPNAILGAFKRTGLECSYSNFSLLEILWYGKEVEWITNGNSLSIYICITQIQSDNVNLPDHPFLFLFVPTTELLVKTSGLFSYMNFSTLICRSLNILDPLLVRRESSSSITSLGMLIFFPRFSLDPSCGMTEGVQEEAYYKSRRSLL